MLVKNRSQNEEKTYLMTGSANNGWEDCTRRVVPSETGFAHARSIVHNEGLNFFVTHVRYN